ncbi:SDR family NAD(P)-dependent oxidoreductase [Deinococcus roseus]|uniref:Short-chain dehydrogenase n=1 Tax=Deinococcus roseus TaxID=392414 RepID=A0ABQ2CX92_9DEIO|nr:SDR family oxidoreductase [Deinococcus roseus]GGJ26056.1 short-chain dehydrogenase [Deinococcus roseus]
MHTMNNTRPTALITGASGGLGFDLAELLAKDGHNLILVARSASKLQNAANTLSKKHGIKVETISQDLSQVGAGQQLVHTLNSKGLQVDVLVNNAGFASYGRFIDLLLSEQLNMIDLNVRALVELTGLLTPGMVKRGKGRVLNIASTAAFLPGPLMAIYYATKAFVLSFGEAISNELEGTGVTVTTFCPGGFASGFQERAAMQDSKLIQGKKLISSAEVAQYGYNAMLKGETVAIQGMGNYLTVQAPRFLPRRVVARMVRSAQERHPA